MYGFKKYLVSLIPLVLLSVLTALLYYLIFGFKYSDGLSLLFVGALCGLIIQITFLHNSEIHIVWHVFCWIGFVILSLLALFYAYMPNQNDKFFNFHPLAAHFGIGLSLATALTIIYSFVVQALSFGEDHPLSSKIIAPIIIFIGGAIGGGYIKLAGFKLVHTLAIVFGLAPIGLMVLLLILFAKFTLLGSCYSEGSSGYNNYHNDNSSSYNDVSTSQIYNALYGLSSSWKSGCTVTLTITDVSVSDSGINIRYEERVDYPERGDYNSAHLIAERNLFSKAKSKVRSLGVDYDIY